MDLIVTFYKREGNFGLDWKDGRPAAEICFPTEQAALDYAARHFDGCPVTGTREWGK